jgi:hypothetical protein
MKKTDNTGLNLPVIERVRDLFEYVVHNNMSVDLIIRALKVNNEYNLYITFCCSTYYERLFPIRPSYYFDYNFIFDINSIHIYLKA